MRCATRRLRYGGLDIYDAWGYLRLMLIRSGVFFGVFVYVTQAAQGCEDAMSRACWMGYSVLSGSEVKVLYTMFMAYCGSPRSRGNDINAPFDLESFSLFCVIQCSGLFGCIRTSSPMPFGSCSSQFAHGHIGFRNRRLQVVCCS